MTMPTIHRILATTALCLAALGVNSCQQMPDLDAADTELPVPPVSAVKLHPSAQKALDKTLSEGLVRDWEFEEDISGYLQHSSTETRYIISVLLNNKCEYLGDGHSILRLYILPDLCRDLDELLNQENPSAKTLDHAVWMASKLKLKNLISFLVNMGAPANKYKLGE